MCDGFKNLIKRVAGIHEKIAEDLPKGGSLICGACKSTAPVREGDVARYLAHGWPKCCGATMRWETSHAEQP